MTTQTKSTDKWVNACSLRTKTGERFWQTKKTATGLIARCLDIGWSSFHVSKEFTPTDAELAKWKKIGVNV